MEKFSILYFKEIQEINLKSLKKIIITKLNFFTFPYFMVIKSLKKKIKKLTNQKMTNLSYIYTEKLNISNLILSMSIFVNYTKYSLYQYIKRRIFKKINNYINSLKNLLVIKTATN